MAEVTVKYLGDGPKYLDLPIPFMSLSAKTGSVVLNPTGKMDQESAENLLQLAPSLYEIVDSAKPQIATTAQEAEEYDVAPSDDNVVAIFEKRAKAAVFARNNAGSKVRKHPEKSGHYEVYVPSPDNRKG